MAEPPAPHITQQGSVSTSSGSKNQVDTTAPAVVVDSNSPIMNDIPMNNNNLELTNDSSMNENNIDLNRSNGTITKDMVVTDDVNMESDNNISNTTPSIGTPSGIGLSNIAPLVPPPPYVWDTTPESQPAPEILQLWTEVGNGIDKSQTGMFLSFYLMFSFIYYRFSYFVLCTNSLT
jgi:hypothetical protein